MPISPAVAVHALRGMHVPEYCIARMANRTIMSSGFRLSVSPLLDRSWVDPYRFFSYHLEMRTISSENSVAYRWV